MSRLLVLYNDPAATFYRRKYIRGIAFETVVDHPSCRCCPQGPGIIIRKLNLSPQDGVAADSAVDELNPFILSGGAGIVFR